MQFIQRQVRACALLVYKSMFKGIVYHSLCALLNSETYVCCRVTVQFYSGTWKTDDANDLNEQKNSRVTYGNGFTVRNEYDPLGQLIRANDQGDTTSGSTGTTWTYEYDRGGNILNKKRYAYTTGALGTAQETVTYSYTDANWRDKLTGITTTNTTGTTTKSISYDEIGNPLNDGEWTYTWENGRQLKQMEKGTAGQAGYMKVEYRYNSEGLRIQKIVTEITGSGTTTTTTDYILHGKNIVHMIRGNDQLHFFYDASGKPAIVEYNGTKYGYIQNLQGDIVGIIDNTGTEVVKYTYDAWGKKLAVTGTLAGSLGMCNPFKYRGYVYDEETGLYYLRSRYYNPEIGRFLNADIVLAISNVNENYYTYCKNNPTNYHDKTGNIPEEGTVVAFGTAYGLDVGLSRVIATGICIDSYGNEAEFISIVGISATEEMQDTPAGMAGIGFSWVIIQQKYKADSVYDIAGKGSYVGGSISAGVSMGIDAIILNKYLNEIDSNDEPDGRQISFGIGVGLDWVHVGNSYTYIRLIKENGVTIPEKMRRWETKKPESPIMEV